MEAAWFRSQTAIVEGGGRTGYTTILFDEDQGANFSCFISLEQELVIIFSPVMALLSFAEPALVFEPSTQPP